MHFHYLIHFVLNPTCQKIILAFDSTAKRITYVKETAELLGLNNVSAVTMREEDGAKADEYRERFDFATARAVAEMRILVELCLPYVKVGGKMIAMKGRNAEFELSSAKKAIAMLGGSDVKIENVHLGDSLMALCYSLNCSDDMKL